MKYLAIVLLIFSFLTSLFSQTIQDKYSSYGRIIKSRLLSAPFPHQKRENGHTYRNNKYPADKHYSDNSVLFFIPNGYKTQPKTDLVIHFHGWYNNIDSVLYQFNMIEQFSKSNKNAIMVIPEGPKNAPDSFGGKLEDENGFKNFILETIDTLLKRKIINSKEIGNIILSGHSGGYHVISYILMRGGMTKNIKEVYFFDAQYGETEKLVYWINNYKVKFINIYTDSGGTKGETELLIDDLKGWKIPFIAKEEKEFTENELAKERLIFIHTPLTHNEVLYKNENFYLYLKSSLLKGIKK
jgi:hypothetical protein